MKLISHNIDTGKGRGYFSRFTMVNCHKNKIVCHINITVYHINLSDKQTTFYTRRRRL